MSAEWSIKNASIVTPSEIFHGTVLVRDGLIAAIDQGACAPRESIDFDGDYLLPGLIDVHTDNLERHIRPRNSVDWPVMAALVAHDAQLAAAGVTTVLDSLCVGTMGIGVRNFDKVKEVIARKASGKRNQIFRSEHLLHLRVELTHPDTATRFGELYEDPDVHLVSLMDHTPGHRQWADLEKYIEMEARDYKISEQDAREHVRMFQESRDKYLLPNRRQVLAIAASRPVALASHDDTTPEHVEEAHSDGITISEFPTTVAAAQAARDRGMHIVAGAPT